METAASIQIILNRFNIWYLEQGCDASILLDTTPSGEPVEKTSRANVFASQIFKYIDRLKADIERECPGVVSCADILAYATREAVK